MKPQNGFTLAEVLITLGIIGVVASLTAPTLVNSIGESKIGPSLSSFVNTFEVGMQNVLVSDELPRITSTDVNTAITLLSKHVLMLPYTKEYVFTDAGKTNTYKFDKSFAQNEAQKIVDSIVKVKY